MVIGTKDLVIEDQEFLVEDLGHDIEIIEEIYHSDNSIILSCIFYNNGRDSGAIPRKCLLKLIKDQLGDQNKVQHELETTQYVWENTGANNGVAPDVYPKVLTVNYKGEMYPSIIFRELEGKTLSMLIQEGISVKDLFSIYENLRNQLQVLNGINVFQLDLNEGNIFISNGKVKIIDYAYALKVDSKGSVDTRIIGSDGFTVTDLRQFNPALSYVERFADTYLKDAVNHSLILKLLNLIGVDHFLDTGSNDLNNNGAFMNTYVALLKSLQNRIYVQEYEFLEKVKAKLGLEEHGYGQKVFELYDLLTRYFEAYYDKYYSGYEIGEEEEGLISDIEGIFKKFNSVIKV